MNNDAEREWQMRELMVQLRKGRAIADATFDEIFPPDARGVSSVYWTPVRVALRAAALLAPKTTMRVLDIGSGVGKFCIVGAAATGAHFAGVEHREHLARIATETARRVGVDTARFFHGPFDIVDITTFEGVYLYNPFEENLWPPEDRLDVSIDLSYEKYDADVRHVQTLLAGARPGTRVVTYHGFGGHMPVGYRHLLRERQHTGYLDLWIKPQ